MPFAGRTCRPAMPHLRAGKTVSYRLTEGAAVAAPVEGAVAKGCVVVSPTADPGCWVGLSVPAACGRPFVVFGLDWLEFPAGGLWVVVNEFCASAGAAPRMANATISVFMIGVPLLFERPEDLLGRSDLADPASVSRPIYMLGRREGRVHRAASGAPCPEGTQRNWLPLPTAALPGCGAERLKQPSL